METDEIPGRIKFKKGELNMKRTISFLLLVVILLVGLVGVVPVAAANESVVLDFDSAATGPFSSLTEDNFELNYIGYGQYQTVVDVGGGNNVLKDSAYDVYGSEVIITEVNGYNFYFNSLDYNNFNNNNGNYCIHVRAFPYPFDWATVRHIELRPISADFSTLTASDLGVEGVPLCSLWVNIVSDTADYSVDNINLTPIIPIVDAGIEIAPDTLNLNSKGVFTAYITLPESYNVADIDISTVTCGGASAIRGVIDNDVLIAKFNRQGLTDVKTGESVALTVSGNLLDGTPFEGSDTIRIID